MPTYEYVCGGCGNKFSLQMTCSERDKGAKACPKCRGRKLSQRFSTVYTKTSRKS